jgi:hypothetical protein
MTSGVRAFGETLGLEVPTRYDEQSHSWVNTMMIADSLLTPMILGMSHRTIWTCRFLAGLLLLTRGKSDSVTLQQRLQIEAASGLLLIVLALRGTISRGFFDNAYLFIGGAIMIANSLMTEVDS